MRCSPPRVEKTHRANRLAGRSDDRADYRDPRRPGRDPRGERGYESSGRERHHHEHEQTEFGGFGRGSARDRMGSEQFRSQDEFGGAGEHEYRDYGRNQPGGVYEHSGERSYRHGGGYGGYGQAPGESGGGFGSGRNYAAEPGWGPGYGDESGPFGRGYDGGYEDRRARDRSESPAGNQGYAGEGAHPGSYGTQQAGYGGHYGAHREFEPGRPAPRHYGQDQYGQGQRQGYSGLGFSGQGYAPSGRGFGPSSVGGPQYGGGYEAAGPGGHGPEGLQERAAPPRRYGHGPKGYQRSDERLKEDISERLMAEPYVDSSDVSVEVKEGKVTLEGTVPERRMKHRIEDIADDCMGVKDIDNRIRVARPGSVSSGSETRLSIGGGQDAGASGAGQSASSGSSTGRGGSE